MSYKKADCDDYIRKWADWCSVHMTAPLALLPITSDYREQTIDAKSRNMIRKANRYFYYQTFNYNLHLGEIYEINISLPERQGKAMSQSYQQYPTAIQIPYDLCNVVHRYVFVGGFDERGTLRAYCALAIVGEIAIINTIIGHGANLSDGIMNGMIDYLVNYVGSTTGCKYLNYLDMINCSVGLASFKSSVGFESIKEDFEY